MEPLLRRDALSVELTAQMVVNRFRGGVIADIIEKESRQHAQPQCSTPLPDCSRIPPNLCKYLDDILLQHKGDISYTCVVCHQYVGEDSLILFKISVSLGGKASCIIESC